MQNTADKTYTAALIGTVAAATNTTGIDVSKAVGDVDVVVTARSNQANTIAITLQESDEESANYTNVAGVSYGDASNVANTSQVQRVNQRALKHYVRLNLVPAGSVNAAVAAIVVTRPIEA